MAEVVDWQQRYSSGTDREPVWPHVGASLTAHCREEGVYDPSLTRGRGAWLHGNDIIFHAGDIMYVNGCYPGIFAGWRRGLVTAEQWKKTKPEH